MPGCANECELAKRAITVNVSSRGSESPLIMEIGEAPGREEDREGFAFVGPSGEKLNTYNSKAGIDKLVRITNTVRCCPWEDGHRKKFGKPKSEHIKQCVQQHLIPEICRYRPKLIVALGDYAWKVFGKGKISAAQGSLYKYTIKALGYPELLREDFDVTVLPTYHPSYALRGNVAGEKAILQALATAKRFLEGETFDASKYQTLTDLDQVDQYIDTLIQWHREGRLSVPAVACDLETEGFDWWRKEKNIVGVGFSYQEGTGFFIPYSAQNSPWHGDPMAILRVRSALKRLFNNVPVIGQNFEFDRRWLWRHMGVQVKLYFDTLSAHKWLFTDTRPNSLEFMAGAYTSMYLHKLEAKDENLYEDDNMGKADIDMVGRLCAGDCDATLRVYAALVKMLHERDAFYEFMEFNMEPTQEMFTLDMAGASFDKEAAAAMGKILKEEKTKISDRVRTTHLHGKTLDELFQPTYKDSKGRPKPLPIQLSSYQRVAHLLYNILHLPAPEKNSTADKHLRGLQRYLDAHFPAGKDWNGVDPAPEVMDQVLVARQVLQDIIDFRSANTLLTRYVNSFTACVLEDGAVHSHYHICHDVTGRSAASKPPMQGLPHPRLINFREAFDSRFKNGLIFETDESQIEVRCLAYHSQDRKMIEMFHTGQDMHRMVAARYLGKQQSEVTKEERTRIKRVVFGMFYDRSAPSISEEYGIPVEEVEGIINAFWDEFQEAKKWKSQTVWYAHQYGGVYGAQKRFRTLPHINNENQEKLMRESERQAGNAPIQGLASDFTQHAVTRMIRRMRNEHFGSAPFHFVHDSFGIDVCSGELFDLMLMADEEFVARAHQIFPWFNVPFKVEHEIGLNIGQCVEVEVDGNKLVTAPTNESGVLDGIANVVSSWYNTREVKVLEDPEGKAYMEAEFGPREPIDRGDEWMAWHNDEYKLPALQPFYKELIGMDIPEKGGESCMK